MTGQNFSHFAMLRSMRPMRHLGVSTPGAPIIDAITGLDERVSIRDYITKVMDGGLRDKLRTSALSDLCSAREAGALSGPLEADESFAWLASWNEFIAGADPAGELADPAVKLVEAFFIGLCTRRKNLESTPRDRHLLARIEPDIMALRLPRIEAALDGMLASGDTRAGRLGAPTERQKNGSAAVFFEAGKPVISVCRKGARFTWHDVSLREIDRDSEMEPAF